MEIRTLKYFLEVARAGNLTRAAERLYISQPTISKYMKDLEDELGTKLFIRSNYNVRLTEAGILLRDRAESILALVGKTEEEVKSSGPAQSGEVWIGVPGYTAMFAVAEAAYSLKKRYPNIRCNFPTWDWREVIERLDKGFLDFSVASYRVDTAKYDYLELPIKETVGVLMRTDDPLAGRDSFTVSDLNGLPLICYKRWAEGVYHPWFGTVAKEANIVATFSLAFTGSLMVKAGMGYAIILNGVVDTGSDSGLLFKPLSDVPPVKVFLIWGKNQTLSPAAKLFLQELRGMTDNGRNSP